MKIEQLIAFLVSMILFFVLGNTQAPTLFRILMNSFGVLCLVLMIKELSRAARNRKH